MSMPQGAPGRRADLLSRGLPVLLMALLLIAVGALVQPKGLLDAPVAHLILAVTAAALILHRLDRALPARARAGPSGPLDAWLPAWLAAAAAVAAFTAPMAGVLRPVLAHLALALLALGLVAALRGRRAAALLAVPVLVLYLLVPVLPLFEAALSYPMRRLSAILAAGLLSIGPGEVRLTGTEISWGDLRVSVTSACSGLTLLQNLLWVAWWSVLLRHRAFVTRVAHGLLVVPAVVAANTLRVVVLAVMAVLFGEQILTGPGHVVIGWIAVALAAGLFLLMEHLFPATARAPDPPPPAGRRPEATART